MSGQESSGERLDGTAIRGAERSARNSSTTVVESAGYDGDSENFRVSSGRTRVGRFLSRPRRSGR